MQPPQQLYSQPTVQQYQQPSYMQQTAQRINGRVVQSADMITANDVPMDGSVAFFPTQDLSEIYAKSWDASQIVIMRKRQTEAICKERTNCFLGRKGNA